MGRCSLLFVAARLCFFNEVLTFLYCFDILFFEKLMSSELNLDTRATLLQVFAVSQKLTSLGRF